MNYAHLAQKAYAYETRSRGVGVHYTPLEVARRLVRDALAPLVYRPDGTPKTLEEILSLRILDPALGAGIFLLETCAQLTDFLAQQGENAPDIPARIAANCLFGADIDPGAVAVAREILGEFCGFPDLDPGRNLICADSLKHFGGASSPQFDLVLGNPPFLGGRKIRRALGDDYFRFLTHDFTDGASGNADLCVYFFLLASRLLKPGGVCAFLATNTISEGDSRTSGLDVLLADGAVIYRAETFPWPGTAAVEVTAIHLFFPKGSNLSAPAPILNGKPVPKIFASLKHLDPGRLLHRFPENETLCFQGCVLAAKGFILTPAEARDLLDADPRNRDVIFPYFTGDDVFSAPDPMRMTPRRYVISFGDWPLDRAEEYPLPLKIVRERVKPVRENVRRKAHRKYWWHFGDKRPALMKIIREQKLEKVLIQTRHSKYLAPTWVPTDAIYSESTILFPTRSESLLAILNSGIHEAWVRETSSSIGKELRYSPTDCFFTFPFPPSELTRPDTRFHALRSRLCREWGVGLTTLMNFLHDPQERRQEIEELRETFLQNDAQILAAYGWTDLSPAREFHETPRGIRFELPFDVQEEILHRLSGEWDQ
ncbi:MAG: SAM-dependent DNA methyltransferase [Thermoguttaceae bacterium]|nr:SAM-dependent DNA methyltransferase [Thermoguttaceae bacterium]